MSADAPGVINDDEWEPVDDYELEHAESPSTVIEQMVTEPPHIHSTPRFIPIAITYFLNLNSARMGVMCFLAYPWARV